MIAYAVWRNCCKALNFQSETILTFITILVCGKNIWNYLLKVCMHDRIYKQIIQLKPECISNATTGAKILI